MDRTIRIDSVYPQLKDHPLGKWLVCPNAGMMIHENGHAVFNNEIRSKGIYYSFWGEHVYVECKSRYGSTDGDMIKFCTGDLVRMLKAFDPPIALIFLSNVNVVLHEGRRYLSFYVGLPMMIDGPVFTKDDLSPLMTADEVCMLFDESGM
jgi:hypothetical protein